MPIKNLGEDRTVEFWMGLRLPIPKGMKIPACGACGDMYFSEEILEAMVRAFTPAYLRHLNAVVQEVRVAHGIDVDRVARACCMRERNLVRMLDGTETMGQQTRVLLEVLARSPGEMARLLEDRPWAPLG